MDGLPPSELIAFKSRMKKDTVTPSPRQCSQLTDQEREGQCWGLGGKLARGGGWSAQSSPLVTSLRFSGHGRFSVLHFSFFSISIALSVPSFPCTYLSVPFSVHPFYSPFLSLFLFVLLCSSSLSVISLSLPPGAIDNKRFLSLEFSFALGIFFPRPSLLSCVWLGSSNHDISNWRRDNVRC